MRLPFGSWILPDTPISGWGLSDDNGGTGVDVGVIREKRRNLYGRWEDGDILETCSRREKDFTRRDSLGVPTEGVEEARDESIIDEYSGR